MVIIFSLLKWATFCKHPDWDGLTDAEIVGLVQRKRYVVCSDHFFPGDLKWIASGQRRQPRDGSVVPTIFGSAFDDTNGNELSHLAPPPDKFAARLQGLRHAASNPWFEQSDKDNLSNDDDFEERDYEELLSEIEARFEVETSNLDGKTSRPGMRNNKFLNSKFYLFH